MASRIIEFFGYSPSDTSPLALKARQKFHCPFLNSRCTKKLRDGKPAGVCTLQQTTGGPTICCPNRLYAEEYKILSDVCESAFGRGTRLIRGQSMASCKQDGFNVAVFGHKRGKELRLPTRAKGLRRGNYFVDWILALIGTDGKLKDFVALEVQTIDTTGNYRKERAAYLLGKDSPKRSTAGLNWENVSKRILPQLIYKGHVLQREPLCTKGLFFVCPKPVFDRVEERLGGRPEPIHKQAGSITFRWYDIDSAQHDGAIRPLIFGGEYTTQVNQVALAFTAPQNLPPSRVYEQAIKKELGEP